MKIMSRDFTLREKILLLILAFILLAALYYLAVDQPVRDAVSRAKSQQESLNTELTVLQQKAAVLSRMQNELDTLEKDGTYGEMGSYNNANAELDELNQILQDAKSYDISFTDISREGNLVRRSFSLTFAAEDYAKAEDLITRLYQGKWRCLVSDIRFLADGSNLEEGAVNVGLTATFYETMEGGTPDSGLPADTLSDSSAGTTE